MTAITVERELLEQAVESFVGYRREMRLILGDEESEPCDAEKALRAALAAPATAPKPAAWRYTDARGSYRYHGYKEGFDKKHPILRPVALYTHPATATAPEFPTNWAQMLHYPQCWDTAAYPELRDAIHEALAWSGCSVCNPATAPVKLDPTGSEVHTKQADQPEVTSTGQVSAPSWQDAPTCAGLWWVAGTVGVFHINEAALHIYKGSAHRWYGPIPPDSGDKP